MFHWVKSIWKHNWNKKWMFRFVPVYICSARQYLHIIRRNIKIYYAFFLLCLFYEVIAIKHFFVVFILPSSAYGFVSAAQTFFHFDLPLHIKAFSSLIVINPKWLLDTTCFSFYLENCNAKKILFLCFRCASALKRRKTVSVCFGNVYAVQHASEVHSTSKALKGL